MNELDRFYHELMHKEPDMVPITMPPIRTEEVDISYVTVSGIVTEDVLARGLEFTLDFYRKYPEMIPFTGHVINYGLPDIALGSLHGAKMMSSPEGAHKPKHAFKDLKEAVKKIDIPSDFHKEKKLEPRLNVIRYYAENTPQEFKDRYGAIDNWIGCTGPEGAITGGIIDYEQYLVGMRFFPDLVHELTELVIAFNLEWLKASEDIVGKGTKLLIPDHSPTFMSPAQFDEFFAPYIRKITDAYKGSLIVYHNEGEISRHLKKLPGLGIDAVHIGPETDIGFAKKEIGEKVTLIGNVDPVDVLLRGTPEQVEEACRSDIMKAAPGGGFILSTGGGPPRAVTPEANIRAMINAAKKYGRYPIEG